jgi:hypothetical protein
LSYSCNRTFSVLCFNWVVTSNGSLHPIETTSSPSLLSTVADPRKKNRSLLHISAILSTGHQSLPIRSEWILVKYPTKAGQNKLTYTGSSQGIELQESRRWHSGPSLLWEAPRWRSWEQTWKSQHGGAVFGRTGRHSPWRRASESSRRVP